MGLLGWLSPLAPLCLVSASVLTGVDVSGEDGVGGSPGKLSADYSLRVHSVPGPEADARKATRNKLSMTPGLLHNPPLMEGGCTPEKCRCAVGSILSEGEESPSPELIQLYQKFGFKVFSFPAPSHVVTTTFPYTSTLSIWLATRRERKLCAHPRLEIYQQDQIYFMCPLARQETSIDTQMDGTGADTTSDASSVSLEVGPGSRETSAATLSPGESLRGWDDGASGSSFEELNLEGEGPLGEPRLSPEVEPLGATKWPREPSTPEKGEE
ncbi:unnamed protein product [Nyctereutes procyonoides]|uniref:(raccoon dog) hypothetical protein n=1 Tax=Nyctereutes procyonoides TaxID=34880 RepID=A0A811ZM80_NYCPR|nr:unnamed protein product [Nyctereutes procyonoides]